MTIFRYSLSALSFLMAIFTHSLPALSMDENSLRVVTARRNLDEFLGKAGGVGSFRNALNSLRESQNKAPDEGKVLFLLRSNGYKDYNELTPFDEKWLVHKITGTNYEPLGVVSGENPFSAEKQKILAQRIIRAYNSIFSMNFGDPDNMWLRHFFDLKKPVHQAIIEGREDDLIALLNDPRRSNIFSGFDNGLLLSSKRPHLVDDHTEICANDVFILLRTLAEGVGVRPFRNPECFRDHHVNSMPITQKSVEEMLQSLDIAFGFKVDFPNPYPGEAGLSTSRGIASFRSVQALCQAWKCSQLTDDPASCSVLEIGAGLGRAAYYARNFGFQKYTIVDVPLTIVAQAHFLETTLADGSVKLPGEADVFDRGVRIIPPPTLFAKEEKFGIVVSFDCLTEMTKEVAMEYYRYSERNAEVFLSVNHEANPYTVRDLYTSRKGGKKKVSRVPYLLRSGYVEETITF